MRDAARSRIDISKNGTKMARKFGHGKESPADIHNKPIIEEKKAVQTHDCTALLSPETKNPILEA
jgi:hypothetical protein